MNTERDLFGEALPPDRVRGVGYGPATVFAGRKRRGGPNGYAARPGSGPLGETCKTCAHYCRVEGGSKVFPKCGLMRLRWTHGAATDIRAKSPACKLWKKDEPMPDLSS
jgi:hypothetical protein